MATSKLNEAFLALTISILIVLPPQLIGTLDGLNSWVNSASPHGGLFATLLTDTASFAASLLYILLFLVCDFKANGKMSLFTLELSLSFILSLLIVALLKALTNFPRPGEVPVGWGFLKCAANVSYFAFPSGHTARASIFAYFLGRRWKRLWPLWWGWAVSIALTRLFLHVHWFSDVLFAFMLGPWAGMAVELTEGRWLPIYRGIIRRLNLEVFDVERLP